MNEINTNPRVAYILRSYPRLSQTFILNEILALEQLGLDLQIFAITNPRELLAQARVTDVRAPVEYLEEAMPPGRAAMLAGHMRAALAAPRGYLRALRYILKHKEIDTGYAAASRYTCFTQAIVLARRLREEQRHGRPIGHLHAHFAHDPALIALLVHLLTGIPYSFTAHARDLVQVPVPALTDRIARAQAVITCCAANIDYLVKVVPPAEQRKVRLIYHGVDLQGFQPADPSTKAREDTPRDEEQKNLRVPSRDLRGAEKSILPTSSHVFSDNEKNLRVPSRDFADRPLIVSVGRLVEKKGFDDLLHACARIKQRGYRFRCAIYGEGPLHAELTALIDQLDLAGDVILPGAVEQRELLGVLQQATLFALTPFVTADGDRDGVPNVLIEAMACGLPVVSTAVAGIPELVEHDRNGLLAVPHDVEAIAAGLATLLDDEGRCRQLGAAARRTAVERFDLRAAARQIAALFAQVRATPGVVLDTHTPLIEQQQ